MLCDIKKGASFLITYLPSQPMWWVFAGLFFHVVFSFEREIMLQSKEKNMAEKKEGKTNNQTKRSVDTRRSRAGQGRAGQQGVLG